ncbi:MULTISPECIES: hypothetical protein [Bacteria]|uniref:hypothetical protein n=1 Tax=Bacteria TaxID=2 RepID=UPI000B0190F6|nr:MULTISPECIES: hypothetical protein [Bacteria]
MFRSKIENRSRFLADVDAYIRDHSPVSLEDLIQSMRELGYYCTPRMVRPILKESGLTVKSIKGRWFWGVWDDDQDDDVDNDDEVDEDDDVDEDDEVDNDDEVDERPDPESIKRVEKANKRLQSENNQLMVAMLKTTQLKKSIKAMQEKLLVELADLIHATYGERESESAKQESD